VLSLREDWLAAIGELEQRIPEVFRNRMRVLPLAREQARESITTPAEQLGAHYEPAAGRAAAGRPGWCQLGDHAAAAPADL